MKLHLGDCLVVLKELPENSVDSIVTDPPYGISFMGRQWDYDVPKVEVWKECLRVLKPGGHILCACGTRTQHRMCVNIEDAGFEIRDIVAWIYGSGFPKSLNIGKAIDKLQGNEREVVRIKRHYRHIALVSVSFFASRLTNTHPVELKETKGNSEWEGWGTALKPAMELWTLARKPLSEDSVAENVLKHGVGGINIDGCRVATTDDLAKNYASVRKSDDTMGERGYKMGFRQGKDSVADATDSTALGRFPANLIHDGSDEVVSGFPDTGKSQGGRSGHTNAYSGGSASRFFYCAKASRGERNEGLDEFEDKEYKGTYADDEWSRQNMGNTPKVERAGYKNVHPTVKPVTLMRYLCKLVTPPKGTVLDPFMGSGSTGIACKLEGFDFVGIEKEEEYCKIAEARINSAEGDNPVYLTQGEPVLHKGQTVLF